MLFMITITVLPNLLSFDTEYTKILLAIANQISMRLFKDFDFIVAMEIGEKKYLNVLLNESVTRNMLQKKLTSFVLPLIAIQDACQS